MAVERFSPTTFWEVSRSSRWKPWPEETLRLVCNVTKMLLCGTFLEVECGAYSTFRCFSAPIRNRSGLRCGSPSLVMLCGEGLPSQKLPQQVLKSCVPEEVMGGRIAESSSPMCASADGARLAREELVLQQCLCSSLMTQINPSVVSECVPNALFLFLSE